MLRLVKKNKERHFTDAPCFISVCKLFIKKISPYYLSQVDFKIDLI